MESYPSHVVSHFYHYQSWSSASIIAVLLKVTSTPEFTNTAQGLEFPPTRHEPLQPPKNS